MLLGISSEMCNTEAAMITRIGFWDVVGDMKEVTPKLSGTSRSGSNTSVFAGQLPGALAQSKVCVPVEKCRNQLARSLWSLG